MGLAINELVRNGELKAPIVIGRDHLDCGSVASPNRETEAMKDGSDAVGDWAVLNALINTASGASWVSFHHGGGVGMGYSLHAGMVAVADGSILAEQRLSRVLTSDPGMGIIRHADAGYEKAAQVAEEQDIMIPMKRSGNMPKQIDTILTNIGQLLTMESGGPDQAEACRIFVSRKMPSSAFTTGALFCRTSRSGGRIRGKRHHRLRGRLVTPGLVDPHTHLVFGGSGKRTEFKNSGHVLFGYSGARRRYFVNGQRHESRFRRRTD